jgi:hypothetical protein
LFVCQIYVDDIIFGSTNKSTCEEFSRIMVQKFEMFMMGDRTRHKTRARSPLPKTPEPVPV